MSVSNIVFNVDVTDEIELEPEYINKDYHNNVKKKFMIRNEKRCVVNEYVSGYLDKMLKINISNEAQGGNKDGSINVKFKYLGRFLCVKDNDVIVAKVTKVHYSIIRCDVHQGAIRIIINSMTNFDEEKFYLDKSDQLIYKASNEPVKENDELKLRLSDVDIDNKSKFISSMAFILDVIEYS